MFAKEHRLDRFAFAHAYKNGRKVHMPGFVLVYMNGPTLNVAAVVGKKVAKSAVARNRIRRRLYAALFESNVHSGHVIVIAKPAAKAYSYIALETEVVAALERALGVRTPSR